MSFGVPRRFRDPTVQVYGNWLEEDRIVSRNLLDMMLGMAQKSSFGMTCGWGVYSKERFPKLFLFEATVAKLFWLGLAFLGVIRKSISYDRSNLIFLVHQEIGIEALYIDSGW